MSVEGPPLGLNVEIAGRGGAGDSFRWDSNATSAGDRPKGISFKTKRGDGFADASCSLARRIDGEYVDLGLLRDFKLVGEDGSVAYEGRVTGVPRSMGAQHEISVQAAGWMAHARDRKFREIYVDSDMTKWQSPTSRRKVGLYAASRNIIAPSTVQGGQPKVLLSLPASNPGATGLVPVCEAWYDALGNPIGEIRGTWTKSATVNSDFSYVLATGTADDSPAAFDVTSSLYSGLTSDEAAISATDDDRTWGYLSFYFTGGSFTGTDRTLDWSNLQVFGTSGIARADAGNGLLGVYVSDVIKDIAARFAPMLNTAGVQQTTYPVAQVAYFDRTDPYDAWLALNAFHLWSLSVWEDRTLTYAPVDLTDYDWEVRLDDPGVTVNLQGDSSADLANGIAVSYTDVATGRKVEINPEQHPELADASLENPANEEGLQVWTELNLSSPVTLSMALQLGRAALAEFNAPKAPGTINVQGHVRDRAGRLQPAWKVRADDRVSITDIVADQPRLIAATDYSHDTFSLGMSVDAPAQRLTAVLDRIQSNLDAGGLS